ncbi:DgyrCDS14568 [Dimorphilus gyrociliatus]|uniref:DgyrCDS14568 n=1 Tax=Dimorphilus gyrociliatus TaxID=2664684 RepID=A0A7I8WE36_9ANNE|nr:DgyrCDS14568 [Dimorphilus gyrociliatus]
MDWEMIRKKNTATDLYLGLSPLRVNANGKLNLVRIKISNQVTENVHELTENTQEVLIEGLGSWKRLGYHKGWKESVDKWG